MKTNPRLIVYDLDGTLVDSLGDLADAMNAVLQSRGYPTHPEASYRHFVGDGVGNLVLRALPQEVDPANIFDDCREQMKREYTARMLNRTRPYDGIPEVLAAFQHAGIDQAVFTNKPEPAAREMVGVLFPQFPWVQVIGAASERPLKPDPTGLIELIASHGCRNDEVWYVGDTNTDMHTGISVPVFTIGVTWGFRDAGELRSAGADLLVDHPRELLQALPAPLPPSLPHPPS